MPPAGDYLRNALAGKQFYQGSQTRWEALCGILGFAELAHATGDGNCRAAYQQIWWSLCEYERHNHGGVLSNEAAAGSPCKKATLSRLDRTCRLVNLKGINALQTQPAR